MELQKIYETAVLHLTSEHPETIPVSAHDLINETCNAIKDIPELENLYLRCVYHINGWNENTLEEQIAECHEIIEEISGFLGEYLN